ncbi:caspase family protein [Dankookia sp. P2]|uniref:caspase family protein n=1 Tax=Dankookia sp. P2 TaxID=3423955 RepID=UPI003D67AFBF
MFREFFIPVGPLGGGGKALGHRQAGSAQSGARCGRKVIAPLLLAFTILLLACWSGSASAQGRVALVVGNAAYRLMPALDNPGADARAVAAELSRLGFEGGRVEPLLDLDLAGLLRAVREFGERARGAELAVVYFSGHGLQLAPAPGEVPESYLLPTDARLDDARDLPRQALALRELLAETAQRSRGAVVILLDACRDNPAAARMAGQGTRGAQARSGLIPVAQASLPLGTLVSYATSAGALADDGTGRNSPYAAALARHLRTPERDVAQVLRRVRADVLQATAGRQRPEIVDNLNGDVFLAGPAQPPAPAPQPDPLAADTALWAAVRDSNRREDFEAYLRRFPQGLYADLARNRLAALAPSAPQQPAAVPLLTTPLPAALAPDQPAAPAAALPPTPSPDATSRSPAENTLLGWQRVREGNDIEAVRLYRLAAEKGDAVAQAHLGIMHEQGRGGLPKDEREAVRLYRLAAGQGNAVGQINLGIMYEQGRGGLRKDEREAARLYRLAAGQGHAIAQTNLGNMYEQGRGGLRKDEREAVRLYRLAAGQGDEIAQAQLGLMHEQGRGGLVRSRAEAVRLYRLAAEQGNADARQRLQALGEQVPQPMPPLTEPPADTGTPICGPRGECRG